MRMTMLCAIAGFGLTALAAALSAQNPPPPVELKVGDQAPDFALPGSDGKTHRLSDYRGKTVVLAWFPLAFSGG
jgi:thioredoxin-dependent peroxiredoxin